MLLIDSHVHIHDCFNLQVLLDSAFLNFRSAAARWGEENRFTGMLLLSEGEGEKGFQRLAGFVENREAMTREAIENWAFSRTGENCSLYGESNNRQGFYVVAGRQIPTGEGLEVLALATTEEFERRHAISEVIQSVKACGGIPVVPWGAGKWTGKRRAILENIIRANQGSFFFLGDNGGRPAMVPRSRLFGLAERMGIRVLPGSDPLPFPSEARRAGSFGFSISGSIDPDRPAEDLKRKLLDPVIRPQLFGRLERIDRFVINQFAMQIVKRRRIRGM
jgi:hypothetical protein